MQAVSASYANNLTLQLNKATITERSICTEIYKNRHLQKWLKFANAITNKVVFFTVSQCTIVSV